MADYIPLTIHPPTLRRQPHTSVLPALQASLTTAPSPILLSHPASSPYTTSHDHRPPPARFSHLTPTAPSMLYHSTKSRRRFSQVAISIEQFACTTSEPLLRYPRLPCRYLPTPYPGIQWRPSTSQLDPKTTTYTYLT